MSTRQKALRAMRRRGGCRYKANPLTQRCEACGAAMQDLMDGTSEECWDMTHQVKRDMLKGHRPSRRMLELAGEQVFQFTPREVQRLARYSWARELVDALTDDLGAQVQDLGLKEVMAKDVLRAGV